MQCLRIELLPKPPRGWTLVELPVMATIMILVLAALLASHIYGLKLYALTRSKIQSTAAARALMTRMVGEIYNAENIYVASSYSSPLNPITNAGLLRQGDALQIWVSPSNYVVYFWKPADNTLRRKGGTNEEILGDSIRNSNSLPVFTLEDFAGNVLTNETGNITVGVRMEFRTTNYPATNLLDYYKYETRVSRRSQIEP
jgi:hypothetical protein